MGGSNAGRVNVTAGDWMRDVEKRVLSEERRPVVKSASDLLGPGFGPYAAQTIDWSADETTFNGMFYSAPGAQNSPDSTKSWIGVTEATSDGNGYELVRLYDPVTLTTSGDSYIRYFNTPATTGLRQYTSWSTAGATGVAGGDLSGSYPNPQIAAGVITDADVNAANKDGLATVPSLRTLGAGAQQAAPGNVIPPGSVVMWAASAAPTGWLLCNGASLLRTDYPVLFAALANGALWGTADSTHFYVPDFQVRLPVMPGGGFFPLGAGDNSANITERNDRFWHTHSHTVAGQTADASPPQIGTSGGATVRNSIFGGHAHGGSTGNYGVGQSASASLHPWVGINFIIRAV